MKRFICPDNPDGEHTEAKDLAQAQSLLGCRHCRLCDAGPIEYKDQADIAAEKAEACAAQIREIAGNPRTDDKTKHIQAVVHLCKLLRDLGYPQPVEAYMEIANLEDAWG